MLLKHEMINYSNPKDAEDILGTILFIIDQLSTIHTILAEQLIGGAYDFYEDASTDEIEEAVSEFLHALPDSEEIYEDYWLQENCELITDILNDVKSWMNSYHNIREIDLSFCEIMENYVAIIMSDFQVNRTLECIEENLPELEVDEIYNNYLSKHNIDILEHIEELYCLQQELNLSSDDITTYDEYNTEQQYDELLLKIQTYKIH